jgi:hypothetical protein
MPKLPIRFSLEKKSVYNRRYRVTKRRETTAAHDMESANSEGRTENLDFGG